MTTAVQRLLDQERRRLREVRRRILAGELRPRVGLDQYQLSESMGMSITPLREALRRLRGEGLIDIDVHKDTRVAPLERSPRPANCSRSGWPWTPRPPNWPPSGAPTPTSRP